MEKLEFWDEGGNVETIGSMDEIEGMMDTKTAYRALLGCCYNRAKYKGLSKTIAELKDEKHYEIKCSPLEAAKTFFAFCLKRWYNSIKRRELHVFQKTKHPEKDDGILFGCYVDPTADFGGYFRMYDAEADLQ